MVIYGVTASQSISKPFLAGVLPGVIPAGSPQPVMVAFGVDPVHFGGVLVCCCLTGFSIPPLGENMFIASSIAKVTIEEISVKAIPCVVAMIIAVIVIAMVPEPSLWFPSLFGF